MILIWNNDFYHYPIPILQSALTTWKYLYFSKEYKHNRSRVKMASYLMTDLSINPLHKMYSQNAIVQHILNTNWPFLSFYLPNKNWSSNKLLCTSCFAFTMELKNGGNSKWFSVLTYPVLSGIHGLIWVF